MTQLKTEKKCLIDSFKFMTKYTLIFLLMILIMSCFSPIEDCNPKEQKIAFAAESAQFKKEVINSMPSYLLLKNFITKNLSAILSHNDKKSILITTHSDGTRDSTISPNSSYAFFNYGKGNEIKNQVPENLYPELEKIYKNFNKNNFYSVHFSRDSSISISITNPSEYNEKGIGINHSIEWRNSKYTYMTDSSSLSRDTLLNGGVYTVFIDCYRGM